ncbi:MAG: DUF3891 family protein [Acidobacteria bacterium]|nr:DUF3891 family protein [Acidobacteriota bacterium]
MIVRRDDRELVLVTQPEHAALSGRVIDAWRADDLPTRRTRDTILLATREHDNGWIEIDREPMLDEGSGLPFDFVSLPDAVKQPIWPRATARIGARSPLAGALVAQHALTVLARHRADPSWNGFFATLERERGRLSEGGITQESLDDQYRFVYLGDLVSLVFCNGWSDAFDAYGYRLVLRGSALEIAPDPFEGQRVPMRVSARRIPAIRYRSQAELAAAFARAEPAVLAGVATGPRDWPNVHSPKPMA